MICRGCGANLFDGAKFCQYCGCAVALPQEKEVNICPNCNKVYEDKAQVFCIECGHKIVSGEEAQRLTDMTGKSDTGDFRTDVRPNYLMKLKRISRYKNSTSILAKGICDLYIYSDAIELKKCDKSIVIETYQMSAIRSVSIKPYTWLKRLIMEFKCGDEISFTNDNLFVTSNENMEIAATKIRRQLDRV